jgi:hypothetical protein
MTARLVERVASVAINIGPTMDYFRVFLQEQSGCLAGLVLKEAQIGAALL